MDNPTEGLKVPARDEDDELEDIGNPDEKVPIKLKRKVVRLVKVVATLKGRYMSDYLEEIVMDALTPELEKQLGELKRRRRK